MVGGGRKEGRREGRKGKIGAGLGGAWGVVVFGGGEYMMDMDYLARRGERGRFL